MKVCGIYQIKNLITGDLYIGSSNDVEKRFKDHKRKLITETHHSRILQHAYNKYSLNDFEFSIICKCDKFLKLYIEQIYIDSMSPRYNTAKSSSAPMEGRSHSEETKAKFKLRVVKRGAEHHSFGTKWTKEQKVKWIQIRTGEKRSEEFKIGQRLKNLQNNNVQYLKPYQGQNKLKVYDNKGNVFNSLMECAKHYNVNVATVCDVLKGRSHYLKKIYHLAYSPENVKEVPTMICITCKEEKNIVNFRRKFLDGKYCDERWNFCNKCGSPHKRK